MHASVTVFNSVCIVGLDKPLSEKDLVKVSKKVAYMWKRVGLKLGLEASQLDNIDINNPKSCEDACLDMLFKWRASKKEISRRVLRQALEYCKINQGMVYKLFVIIHMYK